jgi:hypothetical protein
MSKNEKSTFSSNSGTMFHIFLESELMETIKHIQKNENLKNEGEVITHLIENYVKKNVIQQNQIKHEISKTTFDESKYQSSIVTVGDLEFDGRIQFHKLEKILAQVTSENLIKKLPQHKIYGLSGVGMIHRFHTKIFPVKFSLMCLSRMIEEADNPWISLTELKRYTLYSAKIFLEKFNSSPIENKFKINAGFPNQEPKLDADEVDWLSYARSSKRFTEQFVGRKLQKHEGIQMGGALFEMGLIEAKTPNFDEDEIVGGSRDSKIGKIYLTLSENGKKFVSYKNDLINFIYNSKQNEPDSIFSQQEREFYFKKILPGYKFENDFVAYLMKHEQIEHTQEIKTWFKEKFLKFCNSEFPDVEITLKDNDVRMYSNTIMNRLMEFGVFAKDPKSKSGPYTRMQNMSDLR